MQFLLWRFRWFSYNFESFWGMVTSQKDSRFCNFLHHHWFPIPKTLPLCILRPNPSFYQVFWWFRWISDHFELFWGSVTSQNGSRLWNLVILTPPPVFPSKKPYPYAFWYQTHHSIKFSGDLGEFWTILSHFGGLWRHKRGQDFEILYFWHHHQFFHPKTLTNVHF